MAGRAELSPRGAPDPGPGPPRTAASSLAVMAPAPPGSPAGTGQACPSLAPLLPLPGQAGAPGLNPLTSPRSLRRFDKVVSAWKTLIRKLHRVPFPQATWLRVRGEAFLPLHCLGGAAPHFDAFCIRGICDTIHVIRVCRDNSRHLRERRVERPHGQLQSPHFSRQGWTAVVREQV